jgi:hypothetical protein
MATTLDDLIARLTAIRDAEGKNLDIVGPGLELVREHRQGQDEAVRLHLTTAE